MTARAASTSSASCSAFTRAFSASLASLRLAFLSAFSALRCASSWSFVSTSLSSADRFSASAERRSWISLSRWSKAPSMLDIKSWALRISSFTFATFCPAFCRPAVVLAEDSWPAGTADGCGEGTSSSLLSSSRSRGMSGARAVARPADVAGLSNLQAAAVLENSSWRLSNSCKASPQCICDALFFTCSSSSALSPGAATIAAVSTISAAAFASACLASHSASAAA
mmetsp:Transcript_88380/g.159342  ORF Transcript_88380/g.159342 Transcript_88380/m.159342 type:complete len:226 (+) Transcript_88380:93-770(+)